MKELFSLKRAVHGPGPVFSRWDCSGRFLATLGVNRRLHIVDRTGALVDEQLLGAGPAVKPAINQANGQPIVQSILQLEWSSDGALLAIIIDQSFILYLYSIHNQKLKEIDLSLNQNINQANYPSFICWSKLNATLAIGTNKGNLILYHCDRSVNQTVNIAGKHSKRITCGGYNDRNQLALASLDRMLTVSDEKGDLKEQAKLKYDPSDIQFNAQKEDAQASHKRGAPPAKQLGQESTVSINMGRQTILMYNMNDSENPIELAFQSKYGEIVRYWWFGDGYLMIGFSRGYVIAISTHMKEIGEELQSIKVYESALTNLCFNQGINRLAVCGDDGVKIIDMADWKEVKTDQVRFTQDEGDVESMEWTNDGQILTVATTGGYVISYLTSIPQLSAACGPNLAHLSSLRSISVFDASTDQLIDKGTQFTLEVAIEPSFIALGPHHVAAGMNNHAWFYELRTGQCVGEKAYMGSVKQIAINDLYVAVLYDGKVLLHTIHNDDRRHKLADRVVMTEDRIFPLHIEDTTVITYMALTRDYLVYSTDKGTVHHFHITDNQAINEYRHDTPIVSMFLNPLGTRVVFIDANHKGFMYSPVDDHCVDIPSFPASIEAVLFDVLDPHCFVAVDARLGKNVVTFVYAPQTTKGPTVTKLTNTKLPFSFIPVLFYDGSVHGQKASGALSSLLISSHDALSVTMKGAKRTPEKLRQGLTQLLALNRLKQAWDIATVVKQKEQMLLLARKACDQLDIELAIRVYREMRETAMVQSLQEIQFIEDKQLLAGHVCLLSGDYNRASTLFLASTEPVTALQMRRDLLQWDQALKLAVSVKPEAIPSIAREYAAQLEVKGDFGKALEMYEKCQTEATPAHLDYEENRHIAACGIARMTIRLGDLQKGQSLAFASKDKTLMKECASILESMKQFSDAADMFVQAEQYERAASLYNQIKAFGKAAPLMSRITTPKIHYQFAQAKESEGSYQAAITAYEKAKDLDSVIRLYLHHLNQPEMAFEVARKSRSAIGAGMIAKYCVEHLDVALAIEFLFLANRSSEAFTMAKQHNAMDVYAKALGDEDGTTEEYTNIATYYESKGEFAKAAHYHAILGELSHALKLYLQTPQPTAEQIYAAIDVVKKARGTQNGEMLVRQLHDYLIGDSDGVVKDLNYIFRLYLALGDYKQAASTSLLIATQEQLAGSYSAATSILLDIARELNSVKVEVPQELNKQLMLLHSYRLAKLHSAKGNHEGAARMLLRVTKHVSHFPRHAVPILTSTVIECHRSGLKRSAFEVASQLQRPEYRSLIDAKYKKPIETIVRRPTLDEQLEESQTPCPYCQTLLPRTMTECVSCHNEIPWCIVTGEHLVDNDFTQCPGCKFPALHSAYVEHLGMSADSACPMCSAKVQPSQLELFDANRVQAWLYPKEQEEVKQTPVPEADVENEKENENSPQKGPVSALAVKRGQDASAAYSSALDIEVKF